MKTGQMSILFYKQKNLIKNQVYYNFISVFHKQCATKQRLVSIVFEHFSPKCLCSALAAPIYTLR